MIKIKYNYCPRCKELHTADTLCKDMVRQIQNDDNLLKEAMDFANLSSQYHLITSKSLDHIAGGVNKLAGTNLAYEGSHQISRDIQVFQQMNVDSFSKSGVFNSAENAQSYLANASENQLKNLERKFTGTAQEVDWLRDRQSKLSQIFEKSKLLGEETSNAPGIDGKISNRFLGGKTSGVSIKNAASNKGLGTNVRDVFEALEKGTLQPDDTIVGTKGTKSAVEKMLNHNIEKAKLNNDKQLLEKLTTAKDKLKVQEMGNYNKTKESTDRLMKKTKTGQASTQVTGQQLGRQVRNGAIIGAAVSLSIASISNYLQYKNGEISHKEAFVNVGQESLKGALIGGAMAGVSLFLPGGSVGFMTVMAVGFYINTTTTNLLNEIYGNGSVEARLDSAGYIYGTVLNLKDLVNVIDENNKKLKENHREILKKRKEIEKKSNKLDEIMEDL